MTCKTVRLTSICPLFLPRSPNILCDCTYVVVVKAINNIPLAVVVVNAIISVSAFFLLRGGTSVDAMQYVGKMGMKDEMLSLLRLQNNAGFMSVANSTNFLHDQRSHPAYL